MKDYLPMNEKSVLGIVKITDLTTNEILVHQENAIHFGNISWAITKALEGSDEPEAWSRRMPSQASSCSWRMGFPSAHPGDGG